MTLLLCFPVAFAADDDAIVVIGRQADDDPPMTTSTLDEGAIAAANHGQEMALILQQTPGVTAYSDAGGGSGYATFYLRGIHQTRLNLTLDGVPLADGEDFGMYFANVTNLAAGLGRITVQRGAGVSEAGSPAYGGAIDFDTADPAGEFGATASLTVGSFATARGTFHLDTGELGRGWAGAITVSGNSSAGYRDNSDAQQASVLAKATHLGDRSRLDLVALLGRERQQLSYYAVEPEVLDTAPKSNPLGQNDRDAFSQDIAHVRYARTLGRDASLRVSGYYNGGYGWYDLEYAPDIYRYRLDGRQFGVLQSLTAHSGKWTVTQGFSASHFYRTHTSEVAGAELYRNTGFKQEIAAWAKLAWRPEGFDVYADAQVRLARLSYQGSQPIVPVTWAFVNPKVGLRRRFGDHVAAYASAGRSEREPTRSDLFLGEDDASIVHDLHAVKPETVWDGEVGLAVNTDATRLSLDAFWMEFRNEIAATGQQNELGLNLRKNVPSSRRQGVELEWRQSFGRLVRLHNASAVMRAEIDEWSQYFDVYDADFNLLESVPRTFTDVPILLTPQVIVRQSVEVGDPDVAIGRVEAHWQSKTFLDNTDNPAFVTPAYLQLDATVEAALPRSISRAPVRLRLDITNVMGSPNVRPTGYAYQYLVRGADGDTAAGTSYYYQQARRAVYLGVQIGDRASAPRRRP